MSPLNLFGLSIPDEFLHLIQYQYSFVIFRLQVGCPDVDDEQKFLLQVIVADQLIEKHQVDVIKVLLVFRCQLKLWFSILQVLIRKISDQSSSQGRKSLNPGGSVILYHFPDHISGMSDCYMNITSRTDRQFMILAGKFHGRVISQKCISAPSSCILTAFKHETVLRYIHESLQCLHRGTDILKQLTRDRYSFEVSK